jgi:hypothetical protein
MQMHGIGWYMQFILNNQNALPGKCEEAAWAADWQGTKVNLL